MNTQERIRFNLAYFNTLSPSDKTRIQDGFEKNNKLVNNIKIRGMNYE